MTSTIKRTVLAEVTLLILLAAAFVALALVNRQLQRVTEKPMAIVAQVATPNALMNELPTPVPTDVIEVPLPAVTSITPIPTMEGGPPTPFSEPIGDVLPTVTSVVPQHGGPDPGFDLPPPPAFSPTPILTPQPSDPLTASLFAERESIVSLSTDNATLIITGTITKVDLARWTTSDGLRPANPWDSSEGYQIYTPVTVTVDEVIEGSVQPGTKLSIYGYGGQVGQDSLVWAGDDLYDFNEDDRMVLFLFKSNVLRPSELSGLDLWDVYDRFTITSDGYAVNSYQKPLLEDLLEEINVAFND